MKFLLYPVVLLELFIMFGYGVRIISNPNSGDFAMLILNGIILSIVIIALGFKE